MKKKPVRPLPDRRPDYSLFPIEAFPVWLQTTVEEIARAEKITIEAVAASMLAAIAAALGRKVVIKEKEDHEIKMALFILVISPTGERKGKTQLMAVSPIHRAEKKLIKKYADDEQARKYRLKIIKRKLKNLEKKAMRSLEKDNKLWFIQLKRTLIREWP